MHSFIEKTFGHSIRNLSYQQFNKVNVVTNQIYDVIVLQWSNFGVPILAIESNVNEELVNKLIYNFFLMWRRII